MGDESPDQCGTNRCAEVERISSLVTALHADTGEIAWMFQGVPYNPGNFGVFNWSAVAVDPERQVMFGMPVYLAFTSTLKPRPDATERAVTDAGAPVFNESAGSPYAAELGAFASPMGLPCQPPPWGCVAGVDLATGERVYGHENDTVRNLSPIPLPFEMGVRGIGGPIVTRRGLAFLSGIFGDYAGGYDLAIGAESWRARLPAGGQATPSIYLSRDGRQYLVVVAGGHGSTGTERATPSSPTRCLARFRAASRRGRA